MGRTIQINARWRNMMIGLTSNANCKANFEANAFGMISPNINKSNVIEETTTIEPTNQLIAKYFNNPALILSA